MLLRSMAARPGRLRRIAALAVAAVIPVLAGCEAGNNAPVLNWAPQNAGANTTLKAASGSGFIGIRNLFVLGPAPGSALPAGSSAGVFLVLPNTGPRDRLVSISAPGTATSVSLPGGGVTIPRDSTVLLSGPRPSVVLHGLTHTLISGGTVKMVFSFQNAGSKTVFVPVLAKAQYLQTYSPPASPTPTSSAHRHRHRGAAPSGTPSPGVSNSPIPSPSATR